MNKLVASRLRMQAQAHPEDTCCPEGNSLLPLEELGGKQ